MPDTSNPKTTKFDAKAASDQPVTRRVPAILANYPEISDPAKFLLDQHQRRWKADVHIAHPETGKAPTPEAEEVQAYYAYMATIDPSSATFNPPAFTVSPMPRGGLKTLAAHLLGPAPAPDTDAGQQYLDDQAKLIHLLFRLNSDVLRTDNRYRVGQAVRVPTEFLQK